MAVSKNITTFAPANQKCKVSFIKHVEVGININPSEQWDIALYSEFNTLEEVKAYSAHPAHVAAAKLLAEVKESRSCVDYEN